MIYISRSLDWLKRLDETTLDTIGRTSAITLEKYGLREVRDIVAYRADLAFRPGAVDDDVLDLTAQISMAYGGVRYALELLLGLGGYDALAEGEPAPRQARRPGFNGEPPDG